MFEELYAPLPDKSRYLERIGLTEAPAPTLETLDRLILAQLRHVPFENLDVYDADAEVSLAIEDLFDKIVVRRRGGYCFELNALFMSLLKEIGFDCYPVMVRVVWNGGAGVPADFAPRRHRHHRQRPVFLRCRLRRTGALQRHPA